MDRVKGIRARLEKALEPRHIEITDDSHRHVGHTGAAAGGGHFTVSIISNRFIGHSTIERHKMVYRAVDDMLAAEIHALSIQAKTVEEVSSNNSG